MKMMILIDEVDVIDYLKHVEHDGEKLLSEYYFLFIGKRVVRR